MEVMRTIVGIVVGVCALAACGGGGGSEPVSADEAEDLCRPACERDEACNPAEPADICTQQCAAEFAGWADADALEAYTDCYADLACGVQDTCLGTVQPQSIHEEYEARCREVVTCLNAESIDAF